MKTLELVSSLDFSEMSSISGGDAGDGAYLIGRTYIWTTAHILTFGLSTIYLIGKNID